MATRFYFPSTGSPAVNPAYHASWDDVTRVVRNATVTTRINSGAATLNMGETADNTDKDYLLRQYTSAQLAAQTIAAQTIRLQIRGVEANAANNLQLVVSIRSYNGSSFQDIITFARSGREVVTAPTNTYYSGTSNAVTIADGDRIVIEIGLGGDPDSGGHNGALFICDNSGTDLGNNTTDTAAYNPWVEFANTLTFFSGTFHLSKTDGIVIGDNQSEGMAASVSRTDGINAGSSISEIGAMSTLRTDGVKIGDKQKWSGLGMTMFTPWNDVTMNAELDILVANGFDKIRLDIPDYNNAAWLAESKEGVIAAVAKGFKVIWGISSFDITLTTSNYDDYEAAVSAAAAWAQANGVWEFIVGNEIEYHVDNDTIPQQSVPGLMKDLATQCQPIFTNGNIGYNTGSWAIENVWDDEVLGDLDVIGMNVYREPAGATAWDDRVDLFVAQFGSAGYISEFNLHSTSIVSYSADTDVQASATKEMIEYFKSAGISRAYYFDWKEDAEGVRNADGSYKQKIWNVMLNSQNNSIGMTASPVMTDGISIGESRLISALMNLNKTDSIVIGDNRTISLLSAILLTMIDGFKIGATPTENTTANLVRTDGIVFGDTKLITAAMSLFKTDGFVLSDELLISLTGVIYELIRTDGFKIGDIPTENIVAEVTKTDGIKLGDSRTLTNAILTSVIDGIKIGDTRVLTFLTALLSRIDGLKVGDSRSETMTADTSRTDGIKLEDTRLINMLATLSRTDGIKLSDAISITLIVLLTLNNIIATLQIKKDIGGNL